MKFKTVPFKAISIITLSTLLLVACDDTRVRISADTGHGYSGPRGHGAYLTRTPHNHRVSFDSALGMYIVMGLANTYWDNGNYYRYGGGGWQSSPDYRRWSRMQQGRVPPQLYTRHHRQEAPRYRNNDRVRITDPRRPRPNVYWNR